MAARFLALSLLLAGLLGACSVPTARPPTIDAERIREEARRQHELVLVGARPVSHHSRSREFTELDDDLATAKRLMDVGWRVLNGGAPLCEDAVAAQAGFLLATIHDIPEALRPAYHARYRFEDEAAVLAVASGSPAERAGLRPGDLVLAVDGQPIAKSARAGREVEEKLAGRVGLPTKLAIRRDHIDRDAEIIPAAACNSRLMLVRRGSVNAFANGEVVAVYSGLMAFLDDDDHLATVIGHEIAHNIRRHVLMQTANEETGAVFGDVLGMLTGARELKQHWAEIGGRAFSQGFESEADYVGLYLTALAGFDVVKAPLLWRRMAIANPLTIGHATTHPTTPNRFVLLEATLREIEAKRVGGLPMVPERREGLF